MQILKTLLAICRGGRKILGILIRSSISQSVMTCRILQIDVPSNVTCAVKRLTRTEDSNANIPGRSGAVYQDQGCDPDCRLLRPNLTSWQPRSEDRHRPLRCSSVDSRPLLRPSWNRSRTIREEEETWVFAGWILASYWQPKVKEHTHIYLMLSLCCNPILWL